MPDQPHGDLTQYVQSLLGRPTDPKPEGAGLSWMDEADGTGASSGWRRPGQQTAHEDTDVVQARSVQARLLPTPPRLPGITCAARFDPMHDVSGDFYDFLTLEGGRLAIVQGDVSGHGIAAGLVMALAKQTVRICADRDEGALATMIRANHWLYGAMAGKFVSVSMLVLDPSLGEARLVRAGHTPTIRINVHTGDLEVLSPKGMAVGFREDAAFAAGTEELRLRITTGDIFVLVTDGILEAKDKNDDEFGDERLAEVIRAHAHAGPDALVNRIIDAARAFQGSARLSDDAMAVAVAAQ